MISIPFVRLRRQVPRGSHPENVCALAAGGSLAHGDGIIGTVEIPSVHGSSAVGKPRNGSNSGAAAPKFDGNARYPRRSSALDAVKSERQRSSGIRRPRTRDTAARGHAARRVSHLFAIGRAVTSRAAAPDGVRPTTAVMAAGTRCGKFATGSVSSCAARPAPASSSVTWNIKRGVRRGGGRLSMTGGR